jgi:transcriptional regulator with XRE-family HTH domain
MVLNVQHESDGVARDFGNAVRKRRAALGISQRGFSELLMEKTGVKLDPSAVTRIERGQRELKLSEALAIATVLDVKVDTLTRHIEPAESPGLIEVRDAYQQLRNAHATVLAQIEALYGAAYALAIPLAADADTRQLLPPAELKKMANDARGAEAACRKLLAVLGDSPPVYGHMSHVRLGNIPLGFEEALEILKQAANDAKT